MRRLAVILATLLLGSGMQPVFAQEAGHMPSREYKVKGGFLYNFLMFIEWSEDAFADENASIILGIYGQNPFGTYLQLIQDKGIGDRRLKVVFFSKFPDPSTPCNMLFLPGMDLKRARPLLERAQDSYLLMVGETEGFAAAGGAINFFEQDGSIRFEINREAALSRGHKFSSKLLKLATIVSTRDE